MKKFVLMQYPYKISKNGKYFYATIGLKELYPNQGFSSCDKFGNSDYLGPFSPSSLQYAFLDKQSRESFEGEIIYNKQEEIYFAVVKEI